MTRAKRALGEFAISGVVTNTGFLHELLARPDVLAGKTHTRYVEDHTGALVAAAANWKPATLGTELAAGPVARASVIAPTPLGTVEVPATMQGKIVTIDVKHVAAGRRGGA